MINDDTRNVCCVFGDSAIEKKKRERKYERKTKVEQNVVTCTVKLVQGLEIYSRDWMPSEFHKNLKSYLGMPERTNELFIKLKGIPSLCCEIQKILTTKFWVSHG